MKLLTEAASNAKTAKNIQHSEYLSYILHLAPADLSGVNVCPAASQGCKAACLNSAGRGAFSNVQAARVRKTLLLVKQRAVFMEQLFADLTAVQRKASKQGKRAVVRLNGTSDLNWVALKFANGLNAFEAFPEIIYYDYTKLLSRLKMKQYSNYHLTFSRSETNDADCIEALRLGYNVAVVFNDIPEVFMDRPVVSGDDHDLRFLDPKGVVVGLKAKGKARRDASGFVILTGCNTAKRGA